jgi:hypothetical protein
VGDEQLPVLASKTLAVLSRLAEASFDASAFHAMAKTQSLWLVMFKILLSAT